MTTRLIFNALAACGMSVFTGALLFIGIALGSYWQSLPPSEFLDWFSKNGRFIGRALPLPLVVAVVGLAGSLWLGWSDQRQRYLWSAALVCIVALLVVTATYNGPMNRQFASGSIAPEQVPAALNLWLTTHAIRVFLGLIASVLGIIATSR